MAQDLGIKRCWFHASKSHPHYDIPKKRITEIQNKCIVISGKLLIKIIKRKMTRKDLTYKIFWSEDDQEFVATCEEMPGLSVLNKNPEQAFKKFLSMM